MEPTIFAIDPYILAFVKGNFIAMGIAYVVFKGIAALTQTKTDDKIVRIVREAIAATTERELPDPDFSDGNEIQHEPRESQ